jgi:DNA repair protein SbcD/Mre11
MRIRFIHTSDWHLGQRLLLQERGEEHELALNWLHDLILAEKAQGLIVAGDIFDNGNPPHPARKLYYRFLTSLLKSECRHIIIIGGNHDSPGMLEAPKDLLQYLDIQVIGAASPNLADDILPLKNKNGELEAVIAAIPFLRDRDLVVSQSGETSLDRISRIQEAIRQRYEDMAALCEPFAGQKVPIIATGHLYANGAQASGTQNNIYIGDTENLDVSQLPDTFTYMALGHIHRPQLVGGLAKARYAGSLIPLSFSETKDEKGVWILDFEGDQLVEARFAVCPIFRRLKTIRGAVGEVEKKLLEFAEKERAGLKSWVEIIVESDTFIPQLDSRLRDFCQKLPLEILKIRLERQGQSPNDDLWTAPSLDALDVMEVFHKIGEKKGRNPEEWREIELTFRELWNQLNQAEEPSAQP